MGVVTDQPVEVSGPTSWWRRERGFAKTNHGDLDAVEGALYLARCPQTGEAEGQRQIAIGPRCLLSNGRDEYWAEGPPWWFRTGLAVIELLRISNRRKSSLIVAQRMKILKMTKLVRA